MLFDERGAVMASEFAGRFRHFGIDLPPNDVQTRRRGRIGENGWVIWYAFGIDAEGEFLDYYASHRLTDDIHRRVRPDGCVTRLPAYSSLRRSSADPLNDAEYEREYRENCRHVRELLLAKGFVDEVDSVANSQSLLRLD